MDVNHDGQASRDLFLEYPNLKYVYTEIRVTDPLTVNPSKRFDPPTLTIDLWWDEQDISEHYEPGDQEYFSPNTATQSVPRNFEIDRDFKYITLLDTGNRQDRHPYRWTKPDEIYFDDQGRLVVKMTKPLYLPSGWDTVQITNTFERGKAPY